MHLKKKQFLNYVHLWRELKFVLCTEHQYCYFLKKYILCKRIDYSRIH